MIAVLFKNTQDDYRMITDLYMRHHFRGFSTVTLHAPIHPIINMTHSLWAPLTNNVGRGHVRTVELCIKMCKKFK